MNNHKYIIFNKIRKSGKASKFKKLLEEYFASINFGDDSETLFEKLANYNKKISDFENEQKNINSIEKIIDYQNKKYVNMQIIKI